MTSAAWRRGFKNAIICSVEVVVFLGILTSVISVIFQQPMRDSFGTAFIIFLVLIFSAFVFGWLYGKKQSGSLLLDCGPHPARKLLIIYAVIFLFLGVYSSFGFFASDSHSHFVGGSLSFLLFSGYWLIMATGRLQIREQGIWQYWGLLKWRKIENYHWEGDTDFTLLLKVKTKFPFLARGALPVAAEHKDAIDELIKKHVPLIREEERVPG